MGSIELAAALRQAGDSTNPGENEVWLKEIGPLLPASPLTAAFLADALAPLPGINKAFALEVLACLGRREIAGYVAGLVPTEEDGSVRLFYAQILLRCGDARAYGILEVLYRYSSDHPHEQPGSVPLQWITQTLDKQGSAEARLCKARLTADRA